MEIARKSNIRHAYIVWSFPAIGRKFLLFIYKINQGRIEFKMSVLNKIFKSYSEKEVKRVKPIVNKINSLEEEMKKLSDSELRAKTDYFKNQ